MVGPRGVALAFGFCCSTLLDFLQTHDALTTVTGDALYRPGSDTQFLTLPHCMLGGAKRTLATVLLAFLTSHRFNIWKRGRATPFDFGFCSERSPNRAWSRTGLILGCSWDLVLVGLVGWSRVVFQGFVTFPWELFGRSPGKPFGVQSLDCSYGFSWFGVYPSTIPIGPTE